MKRIIWDEEEAALLVDTYRRIEATLSQKNELLHQLSDVLRKWAISKGLETDERFRNFNGMKFQYELLRYLMTDGEQGLSGNVAKTIAEMAEIYRSEPEKFEKILHRIGWEVWKQKEQSTLYVNSHRLSRFKRFTGFPSFVNTIYSKLRGASIF